MPGVSVSGNTFEDGRRNTNQSVWGSGPWGKNGGGWTGGENDPMGRPKVRQQPWKVVELRLVL